MTVFTITLSPRGARLVMAPSGYTLNLDSLSICLAFCQDWVLTHGETLALKLQSESGEWERTLIIDL